MDQDAVSLLTLLMVAGGFVGSWLRDRRNRAWLIEDRKAATQEIVDRARAEAEASHIRTEAIARELHVETLRTAATLREEQRIEAEAIACKLEHVHVAAREAFKEANDVNLKIANYNKRLIERGAEAVEKLDTIEHIATEHTAQLEEIAENTRKEHP